MILSLSASGLSIKEIAFELNRSHACIKNSLEHARAKLHARSLPQAVANALVKGAIHENDLRSMATRWAGAKI